MRDEDKTVLGCIGMLAYVAVTAPLSAVVYGWALSKLWTWFMVPAFHLPALSIVMAIGITTTVRLITYQSSADAPNEKDEGPFERLLEASIKAFLVPLFMLGFGWCVKQFM